MRNPVAPPSANASVDPSRAPADARASEPAIAPRVLLALATDCATAAGAVLKERFAAPREIHRKGEGLIDLVTDADRSSEALILEKLAAARPRDSVIAEESGGRTGPGAVSWYVDPLDGTINYAHRMPFFCVSVAAFGPAASGERALLAASIFDPMRGELFTAARGEGAWLDGKPLRVSAPATLEAALLCTGFPYDIHERPELPLGLFARLTRRAQGMRRLGSAALDMAWVAAGRMDGFFELGLKPWDTAAAALILAEAGALVTRIDGEAFDVHCGDVLAAPPSIAPLLQRECRAFLQSQGYTPHVFRGC